jgi:hypothetical protein
MTAKRHTAHQLRLAIEGSCGVFGDRDFVIPLQTEDFDAQKRRRDHDRMRLIGCDRILRMQPFEWLTVLGGKRHVMTDVFYSAARFGTSHDGTVAARSDAHRTPGSDAEAPQFLPVLFG